MQHRPEAHGDLVDERLGFDAALLGGLLDLLAMLIQAREEVRRMAEQALAPGDDVGEDLLVGVAQVRGAVGVVDRGGQVELTRHG
jgi:hypothetical protein